MARKKGEGKEEERRREEACIIGFLRCDRERWGRVVCEHVLCVCVCVLGGNEIDSEEEENKEVGFCAYAPVYA